MSITIVAKSTIREGTESGYLALALELVEKSRQESGCISYGLFQDTNDPLTFTMLEVWKDEAAIEEHNHSPHFLEIVPKLAPMRSGPASVNRYLQVL